jgi:hypothetical protein
MEINMKNFLVLVSMILTSISTALAAKPAASEPKKQNLLENLKKEISVKTLKSGRSGRTGGGGGTIGPKVDK